MLKQIIHRGLLSFVALLIGILFYACIVCADEAQAKPKRKVDVVPLRSVQLWEGDAPEAKGKGAEDRPHLDVLLAPAEKANGSAIIVCPGGGYNIRAMDHEGLQVAQWLNDQGIHAFVLSYRIRQAGYEPPVALLDAQRAVRHVRANAKAYGVDPKRIGIMGFSAGAHLASWVGGTFDAGKADDADPVERVSSRPDFIAIIYGEPSQQATDNDPPQPRPVDADTPPTFMALTATDIVDPVFAMRHLETLRSAKVEAELHVFGGDGGHGRGMHRGDPDTGVWPTLMINWLRRNAFFTPLARTSVEGTVTIDGAPLFLGWVSLYPVDNPNAPSASIYWNDVFPQGPTLGHYKIEERYGPVPGRYRVEVRREAKDLIAVPSIAGEEVYTHLTPGDTKPMTIDIKPGANKLNLAIRTK
jgi:acetyl esterase/lipase